ncbi:hainantoxin-XIV-7-like [Aplysia californica]|uniref:Hainantoxin-XIV-7-like n=1 Tax=Aplysia californica TaxID=6500 RepID=A0ABM1AE78_APLCA|nr:hainantoxin-XIV-7-like [Aplysia californica]
MMKVLLCVSALVLVSVNAKVGDECWNESTCDPGECCLKNEDSMIVSKKRSDFGPILGATKGTCQNYRLEGDNCQREDIWDEVTMCPCETGLRCVSREEPRFVPGQYTASLGGLKSIRVCFHHHTGKIQN